MFNNTSQLLMESLEKLLMYVLKHLMALKGTIKMKECTLALAPKLFLLSLLDKE